MNYERLTAQVVQAFSSTVEAKDIYTNGHSMRVADYSREICKRFGLPQKDQQNVYTTGLLHDIGKIGIPDYALNKTFGLTDEEFAIIKTHPVIGANILEVITELPELAIGARYHHERWDGKGYPEGLKGDKIPVLAQIIAVADAYDAMTSSRSYRALLSQETARSEIVRGRGTQFAPVFADIMLQMIDEDPEYRMHG